MRSPFSTTGCRSSSTRALTVRTPDSRAHSRQSAASTKRATSTKRAVDVREARGGRSEAECDKLYNQLVFGGRSDHDPLNCPSYSGGFLDGRAKLSRSESMEHCNATRARSLSNH